MQLVKHPITPCGQRTGLAPRLLAWSSGLLLAAGSHAPAQPLFTDVTSAAGVAFRHVNGSNGKFYFPETVGSGCCFFDADGDGWLDLYFVNGAYWEPTAGAPPRNTFYRNQRNGTFRDETERSGLGDTSYGVGCVAADYDNDGDQDLFVSNLGPDRLYRNNGDGTFIDTAAAAGVDDPRYTAGAAFLDYDQDGWLDLYVAGYIDWSTATERECTRMAGGKPHRIYCAPQQYAGLSDRLYRNNGDGTFANVSTAAGIDSARWNGLGVVCGDYDDDGDTDIYVGNDAAPNLLWINQGDGTFVDNALLAGVGYSIDGLFENGMGVAAGDYDRDGLWDLAVANFQMQPTTIYRGTGGGMFEVASFQVGIAPPSMQRLSWGLHWADFDRDGWEDLFAANGHIYENVELFENNTYWAQQDQLFLNQRDGTFRDVSAQSGAYFQQRHPSRGSACADFDNDGDLDLAVNMNNAPAVILRNDTATDNRWLGVQLEGTRCNRDAVGAVVTVRAGGLERRAERRAGDSFASGSDGRLFFGLGDADRAASITVAWPGGGSDTIADAASGMVHTIRQTE